MADKVEPRDEHLLRRIAAGDEEAFRLFYTRHQDAIFRFALHMTGGREAAEEVAQEAFVTMIREAGRFDAKRGAPQAFLYGIARNHVRRLQERERRYEPLMEEAELQAQIARVQPAQEVLLEGMTRAEVVEQVRSAVTTLPQPYREAVTLCDLQGHEYANAAKILDCPIGTVRSRLARGREMLTARLRAVPAGAKKSASGNR